MRAVPVAVVGCISTTSPFVISAVRNVSIFICHKCIIPTFTPLAPRYPDTRENTIVLLPNHAGPVSSLPDVNRRGAVTRDRESIIQIDRCGEPSELAVNATFPFGEIP